MTSSTMYHYSICSQKAGAIATLPASQEIDQTNEANDRRLPSVGTYRACGLVDHSELVFACSVVAYGQPTIATTGLLSALWDVSLHAGWPFVNKADLIAVVD
jgi:hypothetical protein